MFVFDMFNRKMKMPDADGALPGRETPIPTAKNHYFSGNPLKGPYPAGFEFRHLRPGLLLGRRADVLGDVPGVWVTAAGFAGGFTKNPDLSGILHRPYRPCRGGARRV